MAVLNYDGTNLTSLASSGFFRRFYSEFQDNSGQVWRVEILDSTTTNDGFSFSDNDPQYFVLGPDGFTLTWDGKSDTAHSAFIASNLTFDFLINDNNLKQLASVLGSTVDERFAVGLFKHVPNTSTSSTSTTVQDPSPTGYWAPEWFGIVIPEDVKVLDNEPNSFMRIKANDGLAILNSVQYIDDDGSLFENRDSLAKTIARCLSKIPTSTLWGFNEYDLSTTPNTAIDNVDTALVIPAFFREYLYQYSPNNHKDSTTGVISSPVHLTSILSPTWYDLSSSTDHFGGMLTTKEALSCAGVLKHILQVFQSRLFLSGGSWNFQNPGAIVEDATPQVFQWVSNAKMLDGTAPEDATLTTNKIDFDDNLIEPLKGLNESYLFPIYQALSKHKKGGAGILLQAPYPIGWVMGVNDGYITDDYPWYSVLYHDSSNISTLANEDVLIEDSTVININAGRLRLNETGFGPQAIDQDAVGMFAVFEITIKVGAYYLKRDLAFSGAGDVVTIQRNLASDYDQQFFEQSGNVEWTTTASTYSLVFPFENCDGAAIMPQGSGDNAVNRVGGLHVARRTGNNDHEFMFRTGVWAEDFGTQMAGMSTSLNWSLPELPANAAGHTGISFSAYLDYYKRDGTQFDASATSWLQDSVPGKFEDFRITAGLENSNADALFTATTDENRAILDLGESILGGTYNAGANVNGCLFTDSVNTAGVNAFPINTNWASVGLPAVTQNIHQLNVNERCMERYETHAIKSGTFSFNVGGYMPAWNNVTRKALPELRQIWDITMGNLISSCTPMTLTWTATSRTMDASGIVMSYDRATPITEATNLDDLKDGRNPGGPGPVADPNDPIVGVWNGKGPSSWITDDGTTGIVSLTCSDGASGSSTVTLQGTEDINVQTDHLKTVNISGGAGGITALSYDDTAGGKYAVFAPGQPTASWSLMARHTTGYTSFITPGSTNEVLTMGASKPGWEAASGGESGWFNSTTLMKVMPTEFMANNSKSLMIDDATTDNVHVKCSDSRTSIDVYAIKAIPSGYKATHVHVYGTNATSTSNSVTVRTFDQTDGDLTNTTTGAMNSTIGILEITSSATANILIKVELNSINAVGQDDLFGADITIAAV